MKGTLPNNLWRAAVYQTNFDRRYFPNKFQREPLPKSIWKIMPTKKLYKEKSRRKTSLKRKLFPKNGSNNFSTKDYLEKFYQGNFEDTFPAKKNIRRTISTKASLKRHFPTKQIEDTSLRKQHLKRNLYQKEWRNISTKKSEKRNITSNMARIGTDKTWWTNAFFLNFINFDFCSFSCRKQLDFLGWWFLLDLFSVKIFLDGLFG